MAFAEKRWAAHYASNDAFFDIPEQELMSRFPKARFSCLRVHENMETVRPFILVPFSTLRALFQCLRVQSAIYEKFEALQTERDGLLVFGTFARSNKQEKVSRFLLGRSWDGTSLAAPGNRMDMNKRPFTPLISILRTEETNKISYLARDNVWRGTYKMPSYPPNDDQIWEENVFHVTWRPNVNAEVRTGPDVQGSVTITMPAVSVKEQLEVDNLLPLITNTLRPLYEANEW